MKWRRAGWWAQRAQRGACLADETELGKEGEHARRVDGDEHDELRGACARSVGAWGECMVGGPVGACPERTREWMRGWMSDGVA